MFLSFYALLFFIALAQCSVFVVDDDCIKRCAEELPGTSWKSKIICFDVCKQPERSHQTQEDFNDVPKVVNSAVGILSFLRDLINNLVVFSKGLPMLEDKSDNLFTLLDSDKTQSSIFRKKRDAEFTANLRGRAQADTLSDFALDSGGLSGNMQSQLGYQGLGRGTGRLSAGALNLQGDWNGDIAGDVDLGLKGKLAGLDSGFSGAWQHRGGGNVAGKGTANVYGVTIGGAGGRAQGNYGGVGTFESGIGRHGLFGVDVESTNAGSIYGVGAAGLGHPALGIGAGVVAEGEGSAISQGTGGLGLAYGANGFGLQGSGQSRTNLGGELDLRGGIGSYDKYAQEQTWKG